MITSTITTNCLPKIDLNTFEYKDIELLKLINRYLELKKEPGETINKAEERINGLNQLTTQD